MNIFVVDTDPFLAAKALHDSHVVKMTLETAQLLCTALRQCDGLPHGTWYKSTHRQHPCTIWTCASRENAAWLVEHGLALAAEYTLRFRKAHKSEDVIRRCGSLLSALPDVAPTTFAQAMPEQYHHHDPVIAYRSYYAGEKMYPAGRPARWTGRDRPAWLPA